MISTLALFFGLFFGLNYPEILDHEWPATTCTLVNAKIPSRYCCEASQCNQLCINAESGLPKCDSIISRLNENYDPLACAADSGQCPPTGSTCDGGVDNCNSCCSICEACTTTCSGDPQTCTSSCTTYPCACQGGCDNSYHSNCIISCPNCYSVVLAYAYRTKSGSLEIVTQSKDFKQNKNKAGTFLNDHQLNATSPCRYNPHDLSQIDFDISYTGWKWAITSVFGIIPLAVVLLVCIFCYIRYRKNRPSRREVLHMEPLPATSVQHKNDGRIGV